MTIKSSSIILIIFCTVFFSVRWKESSSIPNNLVGKWNVVQFHSVPKKLFQIQNPVGIQIDPDGMTTGFIGCNRMRTNCTIDGEHIQFGTILTTRKFCEEAYMDVEDRMKDILTNTTQYYINKNMLTFYAGKKKLVTLSKE